MKLMKIYIVIVFCAYNIACAIIAPTEPGPETSMKARRLYMLQLINEVRSSVDNSLPMLYLDMNLNKIAEKHSIDMVKREFFSHTNPDNLGPSQRAKQSNFLYIVGQNLAKARNITKSHQNLMNSPKHYENTINPLWTRCGIGFNYDQNKYLFTTIYFSVRDLAIDPVTQTELLKAKQSLSQYIQSRNPQIVQDVSLSDAIKQWYDIGAYEQKQIKDFLKQTNRSITGVKYNYKGNKMPWGDDLLKRIKEANLFIQNGAAKFGVNLKISDITAQMMVIFTSQ